METPARGFAATSPQGGGADLLTATQNTVRQNAGEKDQAPTSPHSTGSGRGGRGEAAGGGKDVDDILILENFLPYRLMRLSEAVSREFAKAYHDRYGLTRPEWRVFATLGQYGTMTATAIGAHSAMHKTKVSRAVAALEKRKWLSRETDPADRRAERLTLTKAGRAAYREMVPVARDFEAKLLSRIDGREAQQVLDGLAVLRRAIAAS
jgi:DNA-binding MarR family transcriptional regulator